MFKFFSKTNGSLTAEIAEEDLQAASAVVDYFESAFSSLDKDNLSIGSVLSAMADSIPLEDEKLSSIGLGITLILDPTKRSSFAVVLKKRPSLFVKLLKMGRRFRRSTSKSNQYDLNS